MGKKKSAKDRSHGAQKMSSLNIGILTISSANIRIILINQKSGKKAFSIFSRANYPSTFTNVSGKHTFSRSKASANKGAISRSRKPAMPHPMRVT